MEPTKTAINADRMITSHVEAIICGGVSHDTCLSSAHDSLSECDKVVHLLGCAREKTREW